MVSVDFFPIDFLSGIVVADLVVYNFAVGFFALEVLLN